MEVTLDQALHKGIEAHKAGQVQDADRYYTAILKADPKHPDANHNMGVLAVGVGKAQEALPFFKTALEVNPNIGQYWLSYIDALIKLDRIADAKDVLEQAKNNGANGDPFDQLEKRLTSIGKDQEPTKNQVQPLINLYTRGQYNEALKKASELLKQFPNSINLYNIIGVVNQSLGKLEKAIEAYKKATSLKPDYADAYYNIGIALKDQGKLEEAIEAYNKALSITPDYAEAYYNMGVILADLGKPEEAIEAYTNALSLKPDYAEAYNNMGLVLTDLGKPEEAIGAFKKALSIKPDYAEAYNNMGAAVQDQGKLEEAIEAYTNALSIKPDNAEAYNNMGLVLQDQGKLEEAIEAYTNALSIKPDYAEAYRNLSSIKKYTETDAQFLQVQEYYDREGMSDDDKCHLSFALAKMYEDIGDMDKSFACLTKGNSLRKQLLNYSIAQDKDLFSELKITQSYLLRNALEMKESSTDPTPIFILGMPRSGTTLVEQIISSHSEVIGAGELGHVSKFGGHLVLDPTLISTASISKFRDKYLSEVSKLSNGKPFITDKMPQNFRFIPLIYAAFPEAKIVHLQRNAAATCWSNYKQYFKSNSLGYCYDLKDVVTYYKLYKDLMKLWQSEYGDRLYNLNYESLTTDQENQTRKLIQYLNLNWEAACLSPQKNKRSVRTASQQQVKKKVYKGSSEVWRKYEPFLNGAFDGLSFL